MSQVLPKAFTKKGCYMLATILKSEIATEATECEKVCVKNVKYFV